MRGDVVLVRTFGGRPVRRRIWDVTDAAVFVTDDEQFARLAAGEHAIEPIGFPKEDVFKDTASESTESSIDWGRLTPWQ